MHRSCLPIATLLGLCAIGGAALAQEPMPAQRPGLWESSMKMEALGGRLMVMKVCMNEAVGRSLSGVASAYNGRCSAQEWHRTATGMTFHSVCPAQGGGTHTTDGTVTGDFSSHYHLEAVTHVSPPSGPGGGVRRTEMEAKWLGPCPANMKPGDTMLPDGHVVNVPMGR